MGTMTADSAEERAALILLGHAAEPGDPIVGRMLAQSGAVELLGRIRGGRSGLRNEEGLQARLRGVSTDEAVARASRCGATIVTRADRGWPSQLSALGHQTPVALWVAGAADLRLLALRSVAMVGARACTAYGEELARQWSTELADRSWTVVSGAAFGIDAAAHRGALAAGGPTIAVLAGGVDEPYPRAHAGLLARIQDEGLVVSESPPGERVRRQRFLARNRLIAALTRTTVVVEAADRSGTTATARVAAALTRPVLAVPGPVTSPASAGCHRMIRDGDALLAGCLDDVLAALDLTSTAAVGPRSVPERSRDHLAPRERQVLDALPARGTVGVEHVIAGACLAAADALAALGLLVATGWVEEAEGGWRLARAPRA